MGKILIGKSAREFSFPSAVKAISDFYQEKGKDRKTRKQVKKFIYEFFGKIKSIQIY